MFARKMKIITLSLFLALTCTQTPVKANPWFWRGAQFVWSKKAYIGHMWKHHRALSVLLLWPKTTTVALIGWAAATRSR